MTGDAAATFISDRSLSDEAVEQELIEEIDRVLDRPPRRSFAPGELIVHADSTLTEILILTEGKCCFSQQSDFTAIVKAPCRAIDCTRFVFNENGDINDTLPGTRTGIAVDGDKHFVPVPTLAQPETRSSQLSYIAQSELQHRSG